jgi:hypothetical protein
MDKRGRKRRAHRKKGEEFDAIGVCVNLFSSPHDPEDELSGGIRVCVASFSSVFSVGGVVGGSLKVGANQKKNEISFARK